MICPFSVSSHPVTDLILRPRDRDSGRQDSGLTSGQTSQLQSPCTRPASVLSTVVLSKKGQAPRVHFSSWETEACPKSLSQTGAKPELKSTFGLHALDV